MSVGKDRFKRNVNDPEALNWLERNQAKLRELFSSPFIRDFVFEPFKGVFDVEGTPTERQVRTTITSVALANAVIASLPGKLGVGVAVAIALEIYMAFRIARHLGYNLKSPKDARDSLGAAAATAFTTFFLFKEVLGYFFSFFNLVGALPATFLAEFATTTFIGTLLWVGFEAGKKKGKFWLPKHMLLRAIGMTRSILSQQFAILKAGLNLANVRMVGHRLKAYLSGEVVVDRAALRGDVFVPVAMAYLLLRESERLDGPMGQVFIDSIRQAWPELADASVNEIATYMRQYTSEELQGVMNLLQGQMFERMVVLHENGDGDAWFAELHADRNVPGSDMLLTNAETGEQIEVSLKATLSESYVESALLNYPDIPIHATDEVAWALEYTGAVHTTGISHAEVVEVTSENYEELLWQLPSHSEVIGGGLTASMFVSLYPFLIAHLRKRITGEQLSQAVGKVTGKTASAMISRLLFAAALGPIFGWFLLARGAMMASDGLARATEEKTVRRVVYGPGGHGAPSMA